MTLESASDRYQLAFARWQAARSSGRTTLQDKLAVDLAFIAQEIDPLGENPDIISDLEKTAWDKFWKAVQ